MSVKIDKLADRDILQLSINELVMPIYEDQSLIVMIR